jgi:hypothetical protein
VANRYRCGACGNLTRIDVNTTLRTSALHHYSMAGELTLEDEQVLDEVVEEVSCRWCGHGRAVEVLDQSEGCATPLCPQRVRHLPDPPSER